MRQKFDRDIRSRSTVTLKFTTSQDAAYVMQDIEDNGASVDTLAIESVTIRETRVITLTPEQYRMRLQAATAARLTRELVTMHPDARD